MGLLQRLSHDLRAGWVTLRHGTAQAATRALEESELLRYLLRAGWVTLRHGTAQAATRALEESELLRYRLELRKVERQLDDVHADIGERAIELHARGDATERILSDPAVARMMQQIRILQDERTKLLLEMNDITIEEES